MKAPKIAPQLPADLLVRELRPFLDEAFARYHRREFLTSDPVQFLHRYELPEDQEVVGLLSAVLAFGNVKTIARSMERVLEVLGPSPAGAVRDYTLRAKSANSLRGFRHRWIGEEDMHAFLMALSEVLRHWGSVKALAGDAYSRNGTLSGVIAALSEAIEAALPPRAIRSRGIIFLLSSPQNGSACKRWAMYCRWMIRCDEIDTGLWRSKIPASALRIPLDTHVARIVRYLGLTSRQTVNWKMSEEVTAALSLLDPEDPVRYDFALARLGILRDCPHRLIPVKCAPCPIRPVCRLGGEGKDYTGGQVKRIQR